MKTLLFTTLLGLFAAPALSQEVAPSAQRRATSEETSTNPESKARYLLYTKSRSSLRHCARVTIHADDYYIIRMSDGEEQRLPTSILQAHEIVSSCEGMLSQDPPRTSKTPKTLRTSSKPRPEPVARRDVSAGEVIHIALAGTFISSLTGIGGAALGYEMSFISSRSIDTYTGTTLGAVTGAAVGAAMTVTLLGSINDRNGHLLGAVTGGVLGSALGTSLAHAALSQVPLFGGAPHNEGLLYLSILSIPVAASLGATTGYLLTDTPASNLSLLPTRGGAYASFDFTF